MKLTIIDKKNTPLKTANKTLIIENQKLPFHLIDTLLIVGENSLKTTDITAMTEAGINILLLSSNFTKSALITSTNAKSTELKLAQYRIASTVPIKIARWILRQKVNAHANHLQTHQINLDPSPYLQRIEKADDLDALLGIEGSFSRRYFEHFFTLFPKTLHKGKRSKRPPLDPLNALMSWYYTLFYHLIAVRLIGFGFEPGIGYLHRPFRAHFALSSDLLEIFRADINAFVYTIFADKLVSGSDFSKKGGVYLRYAGRKKLYQPFREFHTALTPKIDTAIAELRSML
jgi:CRISPR-associated protein Cas1